MSKVVGVLSGIIGIVLFTVAVVNIVIQLRDGTPWSELSWFLPLCLGFPGLALIGGPMFGLLHADDSNDYVSDGNNDGVTDKVGGDSTGTT